MRRPVAALAAVAFAILASGTPAQVPSSRASEGRAPAASGAKADATKVPIRALDSVDVVVTKRADDRREATTTRIVVLHDEIVRYGDTSLADVLQRLPGITIDDSQQRGSGIRMRGLGVGYTQILLDGQPVPAGFDLDSLSPELIERIEILRAPSADLGTRAIAGTINIVLRKAVLDGHRSVKLRASGAQGQRGYGVDGNVSDRSHALSYIVAGSIDRDTFDRTSRGEQKGFDSGGHADLVWLLTQRRMPRIDRASIAPRLTWNVGDNDTLTSESFVRYRLIRTRNLESTTVVEGAAPTFGSDELTDRYDTTDARTRLDWQHRSPAGSTLVVKLGLGDTHRDGDATFLGFDSRSEFTLDRSVQSGTNERSLTTAGKYLTPLVEGHAIAVGWDGQVTHRDERRLQVDKAPDGTLLAYIDDRFRAHLSRIAFYGQDEWNITPRWSAYLGLRWEGLDTRTSGNAIAGADNASRVLSPIFQTLWKSGETKGDQLRFGVSRTFKAPRISELTPRRYLASNNTQTTPDYEGNPDLRPELAWGIDAAYEHYFAEAGFASISGYMRRIDDIIVDRLANVGGTWISSPANDGAARVRGVEAEAKLDLRQLRKSAPDIRVHVNLARNGSTVDDVPGPDNRLDRQLPFSGNAGFDYVLDDWPLTVGANFGYRAGGTVRESLTQADALPYRRVLDVYALWKVDPKARVRVSLANVLGQDSVSGTSYFDDSGTLRLTTIAPTRMIVRVAVELAL